MPATSALTPIPSAEESINPPRPSIEFIQCLELGYEDKRPVQNQICFQCGKGDDTKTKLSKCAKCQVATYCSRECQILNWKQGVGHKHTCTTYKRVGSEMKLTTETDQANAKAELYGRIRFYVCPYAVFKSLSLGKGFLFIQSECTLAEVSIMLPKNAKGHPIGLRSVLVHYLTVGEFDSEICREDFELAEVRGRLQEAVDSYDQQKIVVILMRFRCGHVALGTAMLAPDYGICKSLGKDYFANSTAGALQLNIDEM